MGRKKDGVAVERRRGYTRRSTSKGGRRGGLSKKKREKGGRGQGGTGSKRLLVRVVYEKVGM